MEGVVVVQPGFDSTALFVSEEGIEYVISYSSRSPFFSLHGRRVSLCAKPYIPDSRRPHMAGPHVRVKNLRVMDPGEGLALVEIGEIAVFSGVFGRKNVANRTKVFHFTEATGTDYLVANPHHWTRQDFATKVPVSVHGYPVKFTAVDGTLSEQAQHPSAPFLWLECHTSLAQGAGRE